MKALCIVLLAATNLLVVLSAIAAVMNWRMWKLEQKQNRTAMYNWNCFILDNLDNPKLKDLLERRNKLILSADGPANPNKPSKR